MKLALGRYKVRDVGLHKRHAYLDVFQYDGRIYYSINGGVPSEAPNLECVPLEGYKIIKKLTKDPQAMRVRTTLTWQDEEGDEFYYEVTDIQVLKNLFNRFPQIAEAAGARKRKPPH